MRQNGVEGRPLPVAGDENGNIVLIRAGMPGRSASLAGLARQVGPAALEGFEDKGLIRPDNSAQRSRLVVGGRAEKPMPPAEGGGRMDAAQFRGLGQAHALDHRLGVIEPTLLLAQMRHRRFGQRVERAPATLAPKPQQPLRAAPADDLSAGAMRATLTLDPLDAGLPSASSVRLPVAFLEDPASAAALSSAANPSARCASLIPEIADSQTEKSSDFIESLLDPTQSNPNQ